MGALRCISVLLATALPVGGATAAVARTPEAAANEATELSIDDCEALPVLPCAPQVAVLRYPLSGTGLALVYSSDRMPGHVDGEGRGPLEQGLGGWSISAVHRYSVARGELLRGDGSRRGLAAILLDDGRLAVAAEDGTEVYEFDDRGRHSRTFDAVTGAVTMSVGWTDAGVTTIEDQSGLVVSVSRSADASVVQVMSRTGSSTVLGLDASGWIEQVVGADGTTSWVAARADGLIERAVAPGAESEFEYDDDGRLVRVSPAGRPVLSFARTDHDGVVTVTTTVAGATAIDTFGRTDGGWRRTHTNAAGVVSVLDVGTAGDRRLTTGDGTTILTTIEPDPRWGDHAPVLTSVQVDGPGMAVRYAEQRSSATSDPDPAVATDSTRTWSTPEASYVLHFVAAERLARIDRGDGHVTEMRFDARGRLVELQPAGAAGAIYEYGDDGTVAEFRLGSGDDARVWTYEHDGAGANSSITTPDGSTTVIGYDVASRPATLARASEASAVVRYDPAGRPAIVTGPGDTTLTTAYSEGGVPILGAVAGADGARAASTLLDANGLPVSISWSDGAVVGLERDEIGRVIGVDDGALTYDLTYDELGRPVSVTGDGVTVTTDWSASIATAQRWTGAVNGTVSWTTDGMGRISSETAQNAEPVAVTRDGQGRVTGLGPMTFDLDVAGRATGQYVGAVDVLRTYNEFGEVIAIEAAVGGIPLYRQTIARDGAGRVAELTDATDVRMSTSAYAYDANSWLSAAMVDGGTSTFDYDADGNLVATRDDAGNVIAAEYDAGDALTRVGERVVEVDGAGRLSSLTTAAGTNRFHYDRSGALQSVVTADGVTIEYVVDGFGRRVGRALDGTLVQGFLYAAGPGPVAELDADGTVAARIVYGPDGTIPAYLIRDGRTYAYVVDHLGSPRLLVDTETGDIAQRIDYDVWGRITADSNPGFQPLGFTGGLVDPLTGLVRLGARDYDPTRGRFTAPDPLGLAGGSPNLYLYAGNNPATHRDPTGLCWFCIDSNVVTIALQVGGGALIGGYGQVQLTIAHDGVSLVPSAGFATGALAGVGATGTVGILHRVGGGPATIDHFVAPGQTRTIEAGAFGAVAGYDATVDSSGDVNYRGLHVGGGLSKGWSFSGTYGQQYSSERLNSWLPSWLSGCSGFGCPRAPTPPTPSPPPVSMPPGECPGPGGIPCAPISCDGATMCLEPPEPPGADDDEDGYDPGGPGSRGEPHLVTVAGDRYDFQGAGEYVLLQSDDGAIVIQARQEPLPASDSLAFNTAIAFGVAGHRIGIYANDADGDLWVDGEPTRLQGVFELGHGASVRPLSSGYEVRWPDGTRAVAWVSMSSIDVSVAVSDSQAGNVHGLIGSPAGTVGQVEARDRTAYRLDEIVASDVLYAEFGASWLLSPDESLFDYAVGRSTESYHLPGFPTVTTPPTAEQLAAAEALCRSIGVAEALLASCAFDVASTGDVSYAIDYAAAVVAVETATPPASMTMETEADPGATAPGSEPIVPDADATVPETDASDDGVIGDGAHVSGELDEIDQRDHFQLDLDGAEEFFVADWVGRTDGCDQFFSINLVDVALHNYPCTGGTVRFRVPDDDGTHVLEVVSVGGVGSYAFDIVTVKPREFELALGDTVGDGDPDGAGSLEVPGRVDRFSFAAGGASAVVLSAVPELCAADTPMYELLDDDGNVVRAARPLCGEPTITLPEPDGRYVLVISSPTLTVADYTFRLEAAGST